MPPAGYLFFASILTAFASIVYPSLEIVSLLLLMATFAVAIVWNEILFPFDREN